MKKLLVVCGPTATGKTALAIDLAKRFNGEVISADSRQVYKKMDIGTGKDLPESSKYKVVSRKDGREIGYWETSGRVKIWLLDIVKPDYRFTVADYLECANSVIEDILKRGKLPILVGGTGFYIKGVVDGIETMGVPPDWELRERLRYYDTKILRDELRKLDPKRLEEMNESDRSNPRRLIRAIEIAKQSTVHSLQSTVADKKSDTLFIGLTAPYQLLYQHIDQRVDARVQEGVEKEIKKLLKQGYSWDKSVLGITIGYQEWHNYMEYRYWELGISERSKLRDDVIQQWKFAEHGYARRQMTWFKKDKRINWFEIDDIDFREKIVDLLKKWYNKV